MGQKREQTGLGAPDYPNQQGRGLGQREQRECYKLEVLLLQLPLAFCTLTQRGNLGHCPNPEVGASGRERGGTEEGRPPRMTLGDTRDLRKRTHSSVLFVLLFLFL